MPASRRVSQRQLELLLAFVEANKDIALGRCSRGPQSNQLLQRAWETLSNKLNSVADGVTKTPEQWRRYWVELKAKTKAKGADIRRNASRTGGGPNKMPPLDEFEERILQLIGRVCVEGLPGVQIPFSTASVPSPQPSTSQAPASASHQSIASASISQQSIAYASTSQQSNASASTFQQPMASTSHATPSTSQMEVEWLEGEEFPMEFLSSQLSLPPALTPSPPPAPTPSPPPAPTPSSPPAPTPSPPPQSLPTRPQPRSSPPRNSSHPYQQVTPSPRRRRREQQLMTPSPQRRRREQLTQSSPRRHSRQHLIRNRDVPQWARSLEERRLAIEERHTRALEELSAMLDRRLGNIENRLREIRDKK